MSSALINYDIYIALFERKARDFHWLIAIPTDLNKRAFVKFHARNTVSGVWSYECAQHDLLASGSLVCFVRIGEH